MYADIHVCMYACMCMCIYVVYPDNTEVVVAEVVIA